MNRIPFNRPAVGEKELEYITRAINSHKLCGDGEFTLACHAWLRNRTGARHALLTGSGTAALDMSAILLELEAGDEVIMPSFTFPSTANAIVLRGAVPVFVDIRQDTLNIDETLIEPAITHKTKAVLVVHYAGIACRMDRIIDICASHDIALLEDAAHAITSTYRGKQLGTLGAMSALSFHETKNFVCGEGGALLINEEKYIQRAEIIREKGTNRSQFYRGEVDKYTWVDLGSSYLPSELQAACLLAQFEKEEQITKARLEVWDYYHTHLEKYERAGLIKRPTVPDDCEHNAHLYYLLMRNEQERDQLLEIYRNQQISCPFHYIPLHSSPAGQKYGRSHGELPITDQTSKRLIRLPLWAGLDKVELQRITSVMDEFLSSLKEKTPIKQAR